MGVTPEDAPSSVVLVTGASRGIGRAIAEDLAAHGSWVWLVARDASALARVAADIRARGGRADWIAWDVTDTAQAAAVVDQVCRAAGTLTGLVNNAGTNRRGPLAAVTPADYDAIMAVNVRGLFFLTQAAVARMPAGGAVVNIASLNSFQVLRHVGVYAASKAAVVQLTYAWAIEAAAHGIRVNAVAPGFIVTDLNRALWDRPDMREWATANTPLARLGMPSDVVGAVRFLLSPESAFVTGAVLVVDGGLLPARLWPL
jgi:NAD(P)-dependent dehydrogenase (short-subunit alcohol dehydrogenase family)